MNSSIYGLGSPENDFMSTEVADICHYRFTSILIITELQNFITIIIVIVPFGRREGKKSGNRRKIEEEEKEKENSQLK